MKGPSEKPLQRVKVYRLNSEGYWDDKGTGHVCVEYLEQAEAVGLVVISEEEKRTLLIHRISREDIYNRQSDDTIITWADPEVGTDIALSFQEASGCEFVWDQILQVQKTYPRSHQNGMGVADVGNGIRRRVIDEFEQVSASLEGLSPEPSSSGPVELPPAELSTLPEIAKILSETTHFQKERVAQQFNRGNYLRKLLDIFRTCEDLEDAEGLTHCYRAIRGAIMLNDTMLLEAMLSEENVMDVVGALEYDPEVIPQQKHREFLRDTVVFKEVVPIVSPVVRGKIHQTYRIGYIKDVVLPRVLDDATFATMSSLMLFNNVEVLTALQNDAQFFPELFQRLKRISPQDEAWGDLVGFLQELCSLAKHLQPATRGQLISKLINLGLFEVMTQVLRSGSEALQLRATDVLLSSLQHDPSPLRAFMLQQKDTELYSLLIAAIIEGPDGGMQEQVVEMLRLLLDPESLQQKVEKNEFLEVFYAKYIGQLVAALGDGRSHDRDGVRDPRSAGPTPSPSPGPSPSAAPATGSGSGTSASPSERVAGPSGEGGGAAAVDGSGGGAGAGGGSGKPKKALSPATTGLVVEILCFCVQHHSYRIKYYILRNNVVEKVLRLVRCRQRWLAVAAIRFLRTCVGLKDDFYNRYIVRGNLMEPVIAVFLENGSRYNLLNSAILELMDFIRTNNIKILLANIVENFGKQLEEIDYVETFKQLRLKYDQGQERPGANGSPTAAMTAAAQRALQDQRRRRDERSLEKDEEDYFNEGDDDEDDLRGRAGSGGRASGPAVAAAANGRRELAPGLFPLVDYDDDEDEDSPSASTHKRHPSAPDSPELPGKRARVSLGSTPPKPGSSGNGRPGSGGGGMGGGAGAGGAGVPEGGVPPRPISPRPVPLASPGRTSGGGLASFWQRGR